MYILDQLKTAKARLEMRHLQTLEVKKEFDKIGELILKTADINCIQEGIDYLYKKNQWDLLNTLYLRSSASQESIRAYLLQQYKKECEELKKGAAKYYIAYKPKEYAKKLDIMLSHTLFTKGATPLFGGCLTDLFIEGASIRSLVKHTSLILTNYPEKREKIKTALIMHKDLLQLTDINSSDFFYLSYIFHQIDLFYGKLQETDSVFSIPKEYVVEVYNKIESLVMQYNEKQVNSYQIKWEIGFLPCEESLEDLALNDHIPILSILNELPIEEAQKMEMLLNINCEGCFKQEMITAFQNRKEHPEKLKYMDIYYVLYNDLLKEQLEDPQEIKKQNIQRKNNEYLAQVKLQKQNGQITNEDIIATIFSTEGYPIFGLFALLEQLPFEDLLALASNLVFEDAELKKQLHRYILQLKQGTAQYSEEIQTLDVQYVKSKIAYEKMVGKS